MTPCSHLVLFSFKAQHEAARCYFTAEPSESVRRLAGALQTEGESFRVNANVKKGRVNPALPVPRGTVKVRLSGNSKRKCVMKTLSRTSRGMIHLKLMNQSAQSRSLGYYKGMFPAERGNGPHYATLKLKEPHSFDAAICFIGSVKERHSSHAAIKSMLDLILTSSYFRHAAL